MTTLINEFTKTCSRTIDNSGERVPTLWVQSEQKNTGRHHPVFNSRVRDTVLCEESLGIEVTRIISGAREMVVLCTFLLADEDVEQAIIEAESHGVRVYCLIAAEARLDRDEPEGEFDQKVLAQHKAMLNRLAGRAMFRTSPNFHAKVVLADPFTPNAEGVLLTANLTTDAMKRNEELLLQLEASEVKQLAGYLKWAMWEGAEHESIESGEFRAVKPLSLIPHPKDRLPIVSTTSRGKQIAHEALAMIEGAKSEIVVSCFGWDVDHSLVRALAAKAKMGVQVTVLARIRPVAMPALEFLAQSGGSVYGFKWLHAKALVVDNRQAMVMSANFQKHGMDEGFELGLKVSGDRLAGIQDTLEHWRLAAKWELRIGATVGDLRGAVQIWNGGGLETIDVRPEMPLLLENVEASSAEALEGQMPEIPSPGRVPYLAHKLVCQWNVVAPKLAKGAKPKLKKRPMDTSIQRKGKPENGEHRSVSYDPPAYTESDGRVVVAIKSACQLDAAIQLRANLKASAIVLE